MAVDWEKLFWKYAEHVGNEEGVDFLTSQMEYNEKLHCHEQWCTDEEWVAIQEGRI